ncbi:MAG: NosD domain-containing protein [Geminicoccaceae bacterium]
MAPARRDFLYGILALPGLTNLTPGIRRADGPTVRNGEELADALARARGGETIVLAPGDFGGVGQFDVTASDVILRANVPLRSILWSPVEVAGARVQLADLAFRSEPETGLLLAAVSACRDSLTIKGKDVEVKGCDFGYFHGRAIMVRPSGLRPHIHDCRFHDSTFDRRYRNADSAIALGFDNPTSRVQLRARVINNRLWNLKASGSALTCKTSGNLVQGNQLSNCKGGYIIRYGVGNSLIGNVSTNSRGIAIGGRGHRIANNRIVGSGKIAVQAGTAAFDNLRNGVHPQSAGTVVEGNSGLLVIGSAYKPMPALDTVVRSHKGSVRLMLQKGTKL